VAQASSGNWYFVEREFKYFKSLNDTQGLSGCLGGRTEPGKGAYSPVVASV